MAFQPNDNVEQKVSQLKATIGIVVDNEDPLQLCRIRCKVQGLLEPEDTTTLPWCRPMSKGNSGRNDYGEFQVPQLYSKVKIHFPDNDVRNPEYTALGDEATDNTQIRLFGEDYPETEGVCDHTGTWTRTNKKEKYKEHLHTSGVYNKMDKEGNVHVYIPKNIVIHVGENFQLQVDKDVCIKALKNLAIDVENEVGFRAGTTMELLAQEGTWEAPTMINLNSGVIFETVETLVEDLEEAIEEVDERHEEVIELQEQIIEAGESTKESLKSLAESLLGTKR